MRGIMPGMVDQSVSVLWSRPLHLRSGSQAMAAASGSLVVAERHSRLVRLDPRSGAELWEQRVEDCWGTAVIAGERCLYLSQAGVLHCFDLGNGQRLWSTPGMNLRYYVSVSGSVVLLGGWRGYHPLIRLALANGKCLPSDGAAFAGAGPLAWPQPVRWRPEHDSAAGAVLIAGTGLPKLLVMAASGAVLREWSLPAPVVFPDGDGSYGVSDDGRVTFLSGRRTVMTFHSVRGVQVLWHHERDLRPQSPILHGDTLWLVEDAGITVIDLSQGVVTEVRPSHGAVCAAALVSGGVLFAFADGSLVTIDRAGNAGARIRLSARIDRLVPADNGLMHAIGEGHLVTLDIPATATVPLC
ncbi:PQQ-binding-like beta-propeller repeat protein [Micromonospora sp. NPDC005305]|uniref:outer membrane protein assembly factor BamB family protein n=1 Tax=Micromonospora sp. NPDC005305 TaxID=3156875 RepID=UPI0033BDE787